MNKIPFALNRASLPEFSMWAKALRSANGKMAVPAVKYWIMYFPLGKYKPGNTHNTCCLL